MNVDLANQADTSSFCPLGHTSRPAFSKRSPLIGIQVPASWVPERRAPPPRDLRSPTTIPGLVCQTLLLRMDSPVRAPREALEKNGPGRQRSPNGGLQKALDTHCGVGWGAARHWSLNTKSSQAGTKRHSQKGSNGTVVLTWQEDQSQPDVWIRNDEVRWGRAMSAVAQKPSIREACSKQGRSLGFRMDSVVTPQHDALRCFLINANELMIIKYSRLQKTRY